MVHIRTFSLAAVGQWEEAKNHLATIRQVSQLVNGPTGKVTARDRHGRLDLLWYQRTKR